MGFHKKGRRPPSPGPDYVWIKTSEGGYWRRKRGTIKKAKLNRPFQEGSKRMKQSAPATSRILDKLAPYTNGLYMGRLHSRISGMLRTSLKESGKADLRCLNGLDLQRDHPLERLLRVNAKTKVTADEVVVMLPVGERTLNRLNTLVTNYYFELVLLYGDAVKANGLRTESMESDVYEIEKNYNLTLKLHLVLPEKPWIALLKVNSIEGDELAQSYKLYGMKVIGAGGV